ncbi:Legumain [Chelonia mydas]|uniref:Legumain n=1 Tax=Chelonia mydas TaxID=8469 RepID=M7C5X2_CHEMY|nr:Legumain [Chelonia mydas]
MQGCLAAPRIRAGEGTSGSCFREPLEADVCHAYQIVHRNGIPDEQIIVMMYDDIAENEENPTKGIIINRPNGTDVYEGVPKDYVQELVFYIEACESGSMMNHLADDINVYATTAANPRESSYACYYDDKRQTYLGDWYSVNWMEDSDVEDLKKETLHKQFLIVKKHTNTSHVMQYGNKSISSMKVVQFQGMGRKSTPISLPPVAHYDLTPSPDVPLEIMKRKLLATNDIYEAKKIAGEMKTHLEAKQIIQESMRKIIFFVTASKERTEQILSDRLTISDYDCYQSAVNYFKAHCFNWHSPLMPVRKSRAAILQL